MKRLIRCASCYETPESKRAIAIHSNVASTIAFAMSGMPYDEIFKVCWARSEPFRIIILPRPYSSMADVIFRDDLQDFRRIVSLRQLQDLIKLAQENNIMMDHKPCSSIY